MIASDLDRAQKTAHELVKLTGLEVQQMHDCARQIAEIGKVLLAMKFAR
jgi:broad specificity phosphatase PhoE